MMLNFLEGAESSEKWLLILNSTIFGLNGELITTVLQISLLSPFLISINSG